ncbi:DUF2231 domain-containing protein [Vitiosangium sp. GDMCC 1.1324]|uniref:DUF2231 domain-containing protein n=1 Tax=Vitiosangium sp. (strain GDMCC 1.1324) TaxID=2138576 RepID=UPI000D34CDD5|nr:DUF2231 domain-containing protein [Vitiosangium sp. GDMCC 1.1324]PTL79423.1 hypothetical protein DAT35_35120 [Vitiosangium sp. GDMCC 1.1324]
MRIRVHELHPMLIHAPLALLPSTVVVDLTAVFTRDRKLDRAARTLWWTTAGSGLLAGLAGMAASQEVKADNRHTRDMMLLHGLGNVVIVLGAFGVAAWRSSRRASLFSGLLGLGSFAFAAYTGWLGGEMVYSHGVGVKELTMKDSELDQLSPPLASRQAPARILRDAVKGLGWLLGRARRVFTGSEQLDPSAFGVKAVEQRMERQPQVTPSDIRSEFRPV